MTLRRYAAVAALAVLAGTAAPAVAAPATRTLTVRGAGNAYADVTFPTAMRLATDDFSRTPPYIRASGTYGGVYLTPLSGKGPAAGTILLSGMPGWNDFALPLGPGQPIPAGRYRVHLLGDGATTVRLTATGLRRDVTVTTSKRSPVTAKLVRRATAGMATPVDRTVIPVSLRRTTLTLLASSHEASGAAGRADICLHLPGQPLRPCAADGGTGTGFTVFGTPGQYGVGVAMVVTPGAVPPGEAEAEFTDVTAGMARGMHAFALTVG